ncbi:hypothetical protein DJ69_06150 [Halorubrum persicum]|uniref:Uncharacterized protein n=1 Tax=Halorubrum persicum TaxID=1383844 RepID=A0A2G1WKF3_9EURY|nr:hypothetical protein [Halorubrum persicum]PHQ39462.1 hypothetical protein DJ69_06150 [Halorubrum persicum]
MSVDRRSDLEVDLDDNRAVATVVEKRTIEVGDLFNDDGELRLWNVLRDTEGMSVRFAGLYHRRWMFTEPAEIMPLADFRSGGCADMPPRDWRS